MPPAVHEHMPVRQGKYGAADRPRTAGGRIQGTVFSPPKRSRAPAHLLNPGRYGGFPVRHMRVSGAAITMEQPVDYAAISANSRVSRPGSAFSMMKSQSAKSLSPARRSPGGSPGRLSPSPSGKSFRRETVDGAFGNAEDLDRLPARVKMPPPEAQQPYCYWTQEFRVCPSTTTTDHRASFSSTPPEKFRVLIQGPSLATCYIKRKQNGMHTVMWSAPLPGQYHVLVLDLKTDTHVRGSPFSVDLAPGTSASNYDVLLSLKQLVTKYKYTWREVFNGFDESHSRRLSQSDIAIGLLKVNANTDQADFSHLWKLMDKLTDKARNGYVDYLEFVTFIETAKKHEERLELGLDDAVAAGQKPGSIFLSPAALHGGGRTPSPQNDGPPSPTRIRPLSAGIPSPIRMGVGTPPSAAPRPVTSPHSPPSSPQPAPPSSSSQSAVEEIVVAATDDTAPGTDGSDGTTATDAEQPPPDGPRPPMEDNGTTDGTEPVPASSSAAAPPAPDSETAAEPSSDGALATAEATPLSPDQDRAAESARGGGDDSDRMSPGNAIGAEAGGGIGAAHNPPLSPTADGDVGNVILDSLYPPGDDYLHGMANWPLRLAAYINEKRFLRVTGGPASPGARVRDDLITYHELFSALDEVIDSLPLGPSKVVVMDLIKKIDANKDGCVQRTEFSEWLETRSGRLQRTYSQRKFEPVSLNSYKGCAGARFQVKQNFHLDIPRSSFNNPVPSRSGRRR